MRVLDYKYSPVYFCGIVTMAYLSIYMFMLFTNKFGSDCISDECRYISFAENLLNGFYSPSAPNINLWSGPGFPIILMPLVSLHADKGMLILLNVLISIAVIEVMFKTATLFHSQLQALVNSFFGLFHISKTKSLYKI